MFVSLVVHANLGLCPGRGFAVTTALASTRSNLDRASSLLSKPFSLENRSISLSCSASPDTSPYLVQLEVSASQLF